MIQVIFKYFTGLKEKIFRNARLVGSWDIYGHYAEKWTFTKMQDSIGYDGCPCFEAIVEFNEDELNEEFFWGVILSGPAGDNQWGIPTEINDISSNFCYRTFKLRSPGTSIQEEKYYLTHQRRLGANKIFKSNQSEPGIQFAVWAPNAKKVEVLFGKRESGYIADDGTGINTEIQPLEMTRDDDDIWKTNPLDPKLSKFSDYLNQPLPL